ncbi:MAG: DUF305 domain-containing protein [Balneolaceae bacterium]|nr:DUF305 domain-containing protein [Balneolaceae bacterium]
MNYQDLNLPSSLKVTLIILFSIGLIAFSGIQDAVAQTSDSTKSKEELEELYWARQDSARMNFTKADVMFMTGMIAHHAQALIMSRLAPENNASPSVQTLASRIINAQKDEINTMQRWLRLRDQPVPKVEIDGLKLNITGVDRKMDHTTMMGMLSPKEMKELSQAKGKEFDRLFLKYMIFHHSGAVKMVTKLFNTDGSAQGDAAFKLASDIQVDQRTEIDRMQRMLDNIKSEEQ